MHNCLYFLLAKDPRQQGVITDVALVKRDNIRNRPAEASCEVVYYSNWPAGIHKRKNGMATDVASASCY